MDAFLINFLISLLEILFVTNCVSVYNTDNALDEVYGKVIFSSLLFRHGSRTPNKAYSNTDPYQPSFWKEGLSQLTKKGKLEEFELGLYFRNRYKNLLERPYHRDVLLVSSSDIDRTLMSAELFLAGFYPPLFNEEIWITDEKLKWQPIPIHTVAKEMDNLVGLTSICSRYDKEAISLSKTTEWLDLFEQNKYLFDYVSNHTGNKFSSDDIVTAFYDLWEIYDETNIEVINNLTIPDWLVKIFPEPLKSASELHFVSYAYTSAMQRIKGGPLLINMIRDMTAKIENPRLNFTFHIYSGHDTTITSFLSNLGLFNKHPPPVASTVIVELREMLEYPYSHYVTISYRNSTKTSPYLLEITNCPNPCLFDNFVTITQSLIISDDSYIELCKIGLFEQLVDWFGDNLFIFFFLVLLFISMIAATFFIKRYINKKCNMHYEQL